MPISYVLAAVQALSGAPGASGDALAIRRYYPMQEPAGITAIYDGRDNTPTGTWNGPPQLRGVYGPAENDSETYGVQFRVPGGEYGDLGTASDAFTAINGRGLFVCVAVKHVASSDRDTILSASDPTGAAGFRIVLNQSQYGLSAFGLESAMFGADLPGGTHFVGASASSVPLMYDNQWHLHMWFMQAPSTIKHWIDGVPKPLTTASNGGAGTLPAAGQSRLIVGALAVGNAVDAGPAQAYTGAMSHLIMIEGEPTQTQMRDLCRAMYYTVRGIPGVIAHYRPSAASCFSDITMQTPSIEGGPIRCLADISGHGNHEMYGHPTDVPTLERAINGGRWCACFDNSTSAVAQWGAESRQQSLDLSPNVTATLVQGHMGCLATVRTQASTSFGKTVQEIVGFRDASGIQYNALDIYFDQPSLTRSGLSILPQNLPYVRCLPGLGIMGFSSGIRGDATTADAFFVNNRWQSPPASPLTNGNGIGYVTRWNLGGSVGQHFPQGGMDMWAGWMEEVIITKCPYLPDEAAAYVAQSFREAGEALVPRYHVCVAGDSIASGNRDDRCRALLGGALPIEARANTSYTNPSIGGLRVGSANNPSSALTSRGLDSPKWWDPAAKNIAAVQAVVNDAHDGDDQATFSQDIDTLIAQMRTGGASVVIWNEETNNGFGPGDTPRNLAIRSRFASGAISREVILTPLPPSGYAVDGLHPTPAGQFIWAGNWWDQGLAPFLIPTRGAGPPAAVRSAPEQ
jgi:hypothetical protein